MTPIGWSGSLLRSAGTSPRPVSTVISMDSGRPLSSVAMWRSGLRISTSGPCSMSAAVTGPSPSASSRSVTGSSRVELQQQLLMLSTISVVSSATPGNGGKLVQHPIDTYRRYRRTRKRRQQNTAQRVAQRNAVAPLQRLDDEAAVVFVALHRLNSRLLYLKHVQQNPPPGGCLVRNGCNIRPLTPGRRFGGRQPLCGIGVTSLIRLTSSPAACSERMAASRPDPGPFTQTSTSRMPCSMAARAARSAAMPAANGVPLRDPLKPVTPGD